MPYPPADPRPPLPGLGAAAVPGGHEHQAGRRLWLIRHGETTGNSSVRYYGATDVPLSDLGRDQVRRLGPLVRAQRFGALVHSPLARAVESARIVLAALAAAPARIEAEELLREVDFGELEGKTAEEIAVEMPDFYADWRAGRIDAYPGGDSIEGFRRRVGEGVDRVLERHPAGDLCIVAHRGVVKNALVHLLGLPWDAVRTWSLDLGSATVLVEAGGRFVLDRYNLVAPEVSMLP
jgi:broad specificity phosphatase PhoE